MIFYLNDFEINYTQKEKDLASNLIILHAIVKSCLKSL